jgi:hypothetical protein
MFSRLERCLRECGSLSPNKHVFGRPQKRRLPDFEEEAIQHFKEQLDTSARSVANTLGVNHMLVWQVLHDEYLQPHHLQKVQAMGSKTLFVVSNFVNVCSNKLYMYLTSWALSSFLMSVPLPRTAISTPETAMFGLKKILTRSMYEATNKARRQCVGRDYRLPSHRPLPLAFAA